MKLYIYIKINLVNKIIKLNVKKTIHVIKRQIIALLAIVLIVFLINFILQPPSIVDYLIVNTSLIYLIYNSNRILFGRLCNFNKINAISYFRLLATSFVSLLVGTVVFSIVLTIVFLLLPRLQNDNILNLVVKEYPGFFGLFVVITLLFMVLELFKGWRNEAVNAEKKKFEELKFQHEILKSQVNPHFLFNSLNILNSFISKDQDKAKEFIQNFSKIYRYVLDKQDVDCVPLCEELDFIKSYFYLIKSRHWRKINTDIQIDNPSKYFIVPMSLQLLVENAIKHNAICKEQPLEINIYIDTVHIVVENNLNPKGICEPSNKIGLKNLSKRYLYLMNQNIEVQKDKERFIVKIPLIKNKLELKARKSIHKQP